MNKETYYEELPVEQHEYCTVHHRNASHMFHGIGWTKICCAPNQAGITLPCSTVPYNPKTKEYTCPIK